MPNSLPGGSRQRVIVLLAPLAAALVGWDTCPAASINLDSYSLSGSVINVGDSDVPDPVTDNLSGVTYNTDTDTLYTVLNNPEEVVELGLDGSVLRTIALDNFEDTEGIVHLGGTKFGILEERRRNLVTISIGLGLGMVASLDRNVDGTVIQLDPYFATGAVNTDLEGVAYDSAADQIYIVRERVPQEIRRFDLSDAESGGSFLVEDPFLPGNLAALGLADLAGLHYHTPTETLLMLSDDSLSLVEVTTDGTLLPGSLSLAGMSQPEGVTVGPDGTIYVVGEGDELAVFTPIPEPGVAGLLVVAAGLLVRRRRAERRSS